MHKILANTQFLGKDFIYLTECHSTSDLAANFVKSGRARHGTTICTGFQTAGRGQRGNIWLCEPNKNLMFSIILKPDSLSVSKIFTLNIAVALAIHSVLRKHDENVAIKWPNDFVDPQFGKLGGILIENSFLGKKVSTSIIGVGINVNQQAFSIEGATSLYNILGVAFSLEDLLSQILEAIEHNYLLLSTRNWEQWKEEYLSSLFLYNRWAKYSDNEDFIGRIVDISAEGQLMMEKQNGAIVGYVAQTLRFKSLQYQ